MNLVVLWETGTDFQILICSCSHRYVSCQEQFPKNGDKNIGRKDTVKDIGRQSRQKSIPEEAGRPLQFLWRRQRPHFVEQHGGAHITVDLGQ